MEIKRSIQSVSGNLTVSDGAVVITDPTKGVVFDDKRLVITNDAGSDVTEVSDV